MTARTNPFRSKIKCKHCQKNYRLKVERGKRKFICGGYHNGNGCTNREIIHEDFILDLLNRRYNKKIACDEIEEVLDHIVIENKILMEIYFKDGSPPILLQGKFIQF